MRNISEPKSNRTQVTYGSVTYPPCSNACRRIQTPPLIFLHLQCISIKFSLALTPSQKLQFLAQISLPRPPDAQYRFLLEVKQMPQWVVSSEVLTTHKVWGRFCLTISNFAQSLATFVLKGYFYWRRRKTFLKRRRHDVQVLKFWLSALEFKILQFLFFCCFYIFLGNFPRF